MKLVKQIGAILLVCALVLSFSACGGKSGSSDALNIMIEVEVQSLDAQVATDGTSFEVIANCVDGLKQMDANGGAIDALCAKEEVSADGLIYTFTIRDDAFWSNGDPVTAADFVFGWQRACDPAIEYSYMMSDVGQIKNAAAIIEGTMPASALGATAVDEKTLKVELEVPVAYFDSLLYFPTFYPVNQKFFEECGDTYATSPETILSNGAYIMKTFEPAATSFTLEKNENYYDADKIKIATLNYQVIKESQQALLSYQNGDLDIILLSGDQVDQVKDDKEFTSVGAGYLWYISANMAQYPELANLNMRKAMMFAIDRQTIVDNVVKDGSTATFTAVPPQFATGPSGDDFSANQEEFKDLCAFDAAKAKEYYEAAKTELGKSTFEFEMIVDDTEIQQKVAAVVKEQLETTFEGMTITLKVEPKKQRVLDMQEGNFCLGLTRWGPDYADPMTYLGMWVTGNSNNYGLWSNAEYDAIIEKCTTGDLKGDPAGRWSALKDAEKIALEECVIFPIYTQCNANMISSKVSGIEFHPVALNRVYKNATKK